MPANGFGGVAEQAKPISHKVRQCEGHFQWRPDWVPLDVVKAIKEIGDIAAVTEVTLRFKVYPFPVQWRTSYFHFLPRFGIDHHHELAGVRSFDTHPPILLL